MKKLIVSTFILLLTIGAGEISAQSFLERLAKDTQKAKSTRAKLDKTKMYTQEQADSYYPLSNPRTLHIDNDFIAREKLKHGGDQKQQRAQNLNVNKLIITVENLSYGYLAYQSWKLNLFALHSCKID